MLSRYSRELIQAIQQSTPDEKVVTFIRDSTAPIAAISGVTDVLSKAEITGPNMPIDDWHSMVRILIHATGRIKELTEDVTLVRSGQYDPSKRISAMLQGLPEEQRESFLHNKESARRLQIWADRLRHYDPEQVLLSLPSELRVKVAMVKGIAELLRTIDQTATKGLPETWDLLLETLDNAAGSLLDTITVTMGPSDMDFDSIQ